MAEATAESLRADRKLRALTKEEDGADMFLLPDGIFGFTYSPAQKEMPVYGKQPFHCFEAHRLHDGSIHMVGFVSPETKARIDGKAGTVEAVLYPAPFGPATALVSLDIANMQPAKKAVTREDGNPLKTLVYAE